MDKKQQLEIARQQLTLAQRRRDDWKELERKAAAQAYQVETSISEIAAAIYRLEKEIEADRLDPENYFQRRAVITADLQQNRAEEIDAKIRHGIG